MVFHVLFISHTVIENISIFVNIGDPGVLLINLLQILFSLHFDAIRQIFRLFFQFPVDLFSKILIQNAQHTGHPENKDDYRRQYAGLKYFLCQP